MGEITKSSVWSAMWVGLIGRETIAWDSESDINEFA